LPRRHRCRHCFSVFTPTRSTRLYCSHSCYIAAGPRVPKRNCAVCGTLFKGASNARLYCGSGCASEANKIKTKARRMAMVA